MSRDDDDHAPPPPRVELRRDATASAEAEAYLRDWYSTATWYSLVEGVDVIGRDARIRTRIRRGADTDAARLVCGALRRGVEQGRVTSARGIVVWASDGGPVERCRNTYD